MIWLRPTSRRLYHPEVETRHDSPRSAAEWDGASLLLHAHASFVIMQHRLSPTFGLHLMPNNRPRYSIVAPVYNEEETLPEFYRRMRAVIDALDGPTELVLVNDGSRDRSLEVAKELQAKDPRVKIVSFSRNFSHQIAITAGMDYAEGEAVVIID